MSEELQNLEPETVQENTEPVTESTADETTEEAKEPVAKTFTQEELNDILQREKAKAEAKAERRARREYKEMLERQAPQQPQQVQQAPKREQYATDEEWLDARDNYRDSMRAQQEQQNHYQQLQADVVKKTNEAYAKAEKIPGFDRETFDELPLTGPMAAALLESDMTANLMAYMTANPEEVERIAGLSNTRQAVEMGKLEMKLAAATAKTSKAPPPIATIGSAKQTGTNLENAGMDEYIKMRKQQGAGWAR